MGQTFYIKLDFKKNSDQARFEKAYDEIFSLSNSMCKSKKLAVKEFIKDLSGSNDWIWINEKENSVSIFAEKLVEIAKTDFSALESIKYNFGKDNAARAEFICAIIAIFLHYFPGSECNQKEMDDKDINDGICLAGLVNTDIKPNKEPSKAIQNILSDLKEEAQIPLEKERLPAKTKIDERKRKLSELVEKVKNKKAKTSYEEEKEETLAFKL